MEDVQKALIQQNNVRWIVQKISEGGDPELKPKPLIEFVSAPYFDTGRGRKSSVSPILVEQSLTGLVENTVVIDPLDCSGIFQDLADFFRSSQNQVAIPSDCYSCKNYSHSPYLKCAVNPARTIDQDCDDFERVSNHYSEYSQKEENDA